MSTQNLEIKIFNNAKMVFHKVAENVNISPERIQILSESTSQDIVKCHQLLKSIDGEEESLSRERLDKICYAIKHTLSAVARDTAPKGMIPHALEEQTIAAIRQCFALISEREMALANKAARVMKPFYADEQQSAPVLVSGPKRS